MLKKLFSIIVLVGCLATSKATIVLEKGDINIVGHVICNGEHVPFANVIIVNTNVGTATDATGHYMLKNLPVGTFTIRVQAVGYVKSEQQITLSENKIYEVNFEVEEDKIGLEQVVVTADRNEISRRHTPVVVNSISPKLFKATGSSFLAEGIKFSPGLRVENNCNNCGFTQLRMNGLEGPYTQILIDSRPVFSGLAGVYGLEQIPANMIQRVEVVRGGGSALFGGNAIAGTVNIITKDPVANTYSLGSDLKIIGLGADKSDDVAYDKNINFNGTVVSSDNNTGLFIFGLKRKRNAWDANKDGVSELTTVDNTSVGLRANHRYSELGKFSFEFHATEEYRRGGNDLELPEHEAELAEMLKHKINSGGITWDQFTSQSRKHKLSIYSSAQHVDRNSYYGADRSLSSYGKSDQMTFSSGIQMTGNIDHFLFAPANYVVGYDNNYSTLDDKKLGYRESFVKERIGKLDTALYKYLGNSLVADQKSIVNGFYAQNQWNFQKLRILLGARVDNYDIKDETKEGEGESGTIFVPRANVMYDITDHFQLRASYSKGYRAPQIFDEDLHINASTARKIIIKNSDDLKKETSDSYTLSFDFNESHGNFQYSFLVEGFYTYLKDPFQLQPGDINEKKELYAIRVNVPNAIVQGVNMEVKLAPLSKLQVQLGATFQKSEYKEETPWGDKDESVSKKMRRTPDNYGFLIADWKFTKQFKLSLNSNYTGKMYVPHLIDENTEYLKHTDSFFELGMKLSYNFKLGNETSVEINGGVNNIFNSYQSDFDKGTARDAGYVYGPMLPRVVFFGLRVGNIL